LPLDDAAGGIAREFWWTNKESSPVDFIPPWFSILIYITWGMKIGSVVASVQIVSPTDANIIILGPDSPPSTVGRQLLSYWAVSVVM
jgi:hypothetical protein